MEVLWSLIYKAKTWRLLTYEAPSIPAKEIAGLNTPKRTSFDKAFWH